MGAIITMFLLLRFGRVPLRYNLRNLIVRWRTTAATALAFVLVIGLLTVMLAFVAGMDRLTSKSGQPGNVVVLSDGATDELESSLSSQDCDDVDTQPGILRDESGQPLSSRETYFVVNQPIPARPGLRPQYRFVQVRGIEDPVCAARVHDLHLVPGSVWFSTAGVVELPSASGKGTIARQLVQAVLGLGIARQLGYDQFNRALQIGDIFELGPRLWLVVGILDSAGSIFDSEIWAKRELVGPMFGKIGLSTLVLRTHNASSANALAVDLNQNFKKAALQAQTEPQYFAKLAQTNRQFLITFLFVAVVVAIGGILGVMNTMFAAISQRTKDIGLLRVLGFSRRQIVVCFLLESMVIGLAGGLLGSSLGSLCHGWTATSIVDNGPGWGGKSVVLKLFVDSTNLTIGLLLSLCMGALGGLLPAWLSTRLRPLESLRT
jgi:cell division protein FtsX